MTDDRAVSTAVSYVLTLGITTLLVTGLLISAGGVVDDRRDVTSRNTLEVVGQRLAAHLMAADRLAGTAETRHVAVEVDLPRNVAGGGYEIRVNGSTSTIVLESEGTDATQRVQFANATAVNDTTVRGGDVRIVYTPADELEVRSA